MMIEYFSIDGVRKTKSSRDSKNKMYQNYVWKSIFIIHSASVFPRVKKEFVLVDELSWDLKISD